MHSKEKLIVMLNLASAGGEKGEVTFETRENIAILTKWILEEVR